MSVSIPEFWKLVIDSRLLTLGDCQKLGEQFGHVKGAAVQGNARTLSEWMISENTISRYQATILLAGRPGPFDYGDYRIYDRFESGRLEGMFRALHRQTGHPVLLFFLTGAVTQNPQLWDDATRRAEMHFAVNHPNLCRCFDLVDEEAFKFLVFEQPAGGSLDEHLATAGRMAPADACRAVRCAAMGLAHLHQMGQVVGDLRPGALWREPTGNVKVIYDPLAIHTPVSLAVRDEEGWLAARADYWAPELAQPNKLPDVLTDIYALGCCFYQLLAGQPPFAGGDFRQKLTRHATEPIVPLEPMGVPQPVAHSVAYMMAKNPAVRYQQGMAVADELAKTLPPDELDIQPAAPPPTQIALEQAVLQRRIQAAGAAPAPAVSLQRASTSQSAAPSQSQPTTATVPQPTVQIDVGPQLLAARYGNQAAHGPGGASATPGAIGSNAQMSAAATFRSRNSNDRTVWVGALIAATVVVVVAAVVVILRSGPGAGPGNGNTANPPIHIPPISLPPDEPPAQPPVVGNGSLPPGDDDPGAGPSHVVVDDDGGLLWASPTSGSPIELRYVAPAAQGYLVFRPADLLGHGEGSRVVRALGPEFQNQRKTWETVTGVRLEQVELFVMALHPSGEQMSRVSMVVHLRGVSTGQLVTAWGGAQPAGQGLGSLYRVRGWTFFVPRDEQNVFAMGSDEDIQEMVASGGAPPILRREVERLRRTSDADRHFTALLAPNFLFAGGRKLFSGPREKLLRPISWFLGDGLQALMISGHVGEGFYWEMRMYGQLDRQPYELVSDCRDRLQQIPGHILDYIASLNTPSFWRKLSIQFPPMIREMHTYTRVGYEGDQAILNCVLYPHAAHNLVLAAELAIASTPGATPAGSGASGSKNPTTLMEVLTQSKMSFSFPQQSLEFAIRDVAREVNDNYPQLKKPLVIKIMGPDLQQDGITRNQQIRDFQVREQTLAQVLTALVMKANPVTTVQEPSQSDQRLVWVTAPDPDPPGKEEIILITTRSAVEKKGYSLPVPFRTQSSGGGVQ